MTIRSVDDFLAKPRWWEYLLLGFCQFTCVIVLVMVFSKLLPAIWAGVAIVGILGTNGAFYFVQKKRNALAVDFYQEWLNALDEKQLVQIKYRFPSELIEGQIVDKLIQQRHRESSEELFRASSQ